MTAGVARAAPRTVRLRGREFALVGPSLRDARLHTAAVLVTVQVLGQTVLEFRLSIAQIFVAVLTAAVAEVVITMRRAHAIVWPASAMLTGNGIALILRVPGTEHGDWWSLRGAWIYAATAALGLASKYLIRVDDRPLFNPSNLGLVVCFLALGSDRVDPLEFWWGPWSPSLAFAVAVIVVGAVLILGRLHLLRIAIGFWAAFAAGLAVVTIPGHCITASWHVGELCGFDFWSTLVTSPEVLIFLGFMITDPRTVPKGARAQTIYGVGIGLVAALLIAPQTTEFGAKVALLSALTIACALRPLLERLPPRGAATARWRRPVAAIAFVAALVGAGIPARPVAADPVASSVEFPAVPAGERPRASVADDRLSSQVDAATAAEIANDVVQDLALQERVLRERDPGLAAAMADRAWLDTLDDRLRAAATSREVEVPVHRIDEVIVSVALRRGQEAPAVLATLRGSVRVDRYRDGVAAPVASGEWGPLDVTYEVLWTGERFVIVSAALPEGWSPPR